MYGLKPRQPWDVLRNADPPGDKLAARADAELSITYAAMSMKAVYDDKNQLTHFTVGEWVYIKLGDGYNIVSNSWLPRKLRQRYVGRFLWSKAQRNQFRGTQARNAKMP